MHFNLACSNKGILMFSNNFFKMGLIIFCKIYKNICVTLLHFETHIGCYHLYVRSLANLKGKLVGTEHCL